MMKVHALFLLLLINTPVFAGAEVYQYEIGGAEPVSPGIYYRQQEQIGAGLQLSGRFSCGKFDMNESVRSLLKNARSRLRTQFVSAVQSTLAALPSIILQRVNPGLYDLFQNLMVRAEGDVRFAAMSCRQIEQAAMNNDTPIAELLANSMKLQWQARLQTNADDIAAAAEEVDEAPGKDGILFCDGQKRGGDVGEPIQPIQQLALIGYNTLAGTDQCMLQGSPQHDAPGLTNLWPTAGDAAKWVSETIGDLEIKTVDSGPQSAKAPKGLAVQVDEQRKKILTALDVMVKRSRGNEIPGQLMTLLDAPGIPMSRDLISALQQQPAPLREIYASRLASEIAMSRVIHKALVAKRMLAAAAMVPEVAAASGMSNFAQQGQEKLDAEIQRLLFEKRTREELVSQTALSLLQTTRKSSATNAALPNVQHRSTTILNGEVQGGDDAGQ